MNTTHASWRSPGLRNTYHQRVPGWLCCFALALATAGWPDPGVAQVAGYPARPVRIVVPFPPGGSVDLVARLMSDKFSESLGQQVIVDNRGGASGAIGSEMVARAAPDGYTLLVHTVPFVTSGFLRSQVPYDVIKDFAPVSMLTSSPAAVGVHPSLPARSVRELLKLAKARPGMLNYGTAGAGTNSHITGELFNLLGRTNIMPVHFKGGAPALTAVISGEIHVSFANIAETMRYAAARRLRALGVSSLKRSAMAPDLPTIAESGLPGFEFLTWHGLLAPRGIPPATLSVLNERVRKTMESREVLQRFQQRGIDVVTNSPKEFAAYLKSELEKWARVIRERKLKAE